MPRVGSISLTTATAITVANMVGTGVFTSLGFQVEKIESGFALLFLWILGGVFALCGALSYGELASVLPRSGGEFHFLSRAFHPALGFLSGWLSVTIGFAAPIALAAMAFGGYAARLVPGSSPLALSLGVVGGVTLAHLFSLRIGSGFQNAFTLLKLLLIALFIGAATTVDETTGIAFGPSASDGRALLSSPFAISLLFVMFAYSGWNAATYIVGEVHRPEVNVPRALALGTSIVLVLYVGLNWAFLHTTPIEELAGELEVGHLAAVRIFGPVGGQLMSGALSLALVSTISAMVWTGPRIAQVMGEDYGFFRALAATNRAGIPGRAILLQSAIVTGLLLTSTFEPVLVYIQLTLVASSFLAVLGVFRLRRRSPELPRPYSTWGYPLTPLLFLAISGVILVYTLLSRPIESLAGMATVLIGLPIYLLSPKRRAQGVAEPR